MDIRTKLVFTLVAVSLGSMLILGAMTYSTARGLLTESSLEQLEALAETNAARVEEVIGDWRERVATVASSSSLTASLRSHGEAPGGVSVGQIRGVLASALDSERTFESLAVYDSQQQLVAATARDDAREGPAAIVPPPAAAEPAVVGATVSRGQPEVTFEAPLVEGGELLGVLRVTLRGSELSAVTNNRQGLGETGESLIVGRDESGVAALLTTTRHPLPAGASVERSDDPAVLALDGAEGQFVDAVDYRGEHVWAATRFLPEVGWGLVVKADAAEEQGAIDRFRSDLTEVGVALAAFAIVLGIVLGLRFANPIHDLAAVATRIRNGELDARASVKREDEIGLFARTFNDMTDELERRMTLLLEFKKFFDVSLDMLCIAGTDGYFKRLNPAFERTLGWTNEQLVDEPFNELIHPDDIEATNHEIEKLAQGIPTISFLNRFRCADGEYKLLMWTSYPEPETGLLYAVARDMTGQAEL